MRTVPDTQPITDAASSAVSSIRDALDHVPTPDRSRLPGAADLPDLSDLGDSVGDLVDSVGDVAGKTAGIVSGATTAALRRLGLISSSHRRRRLVIGGIIVVVVATAVVIARRSRSAGSAERTDAGSADAANADSDAPSTPLVAAVS